MENNKKINKIKEKIIFLGEECEKSHNIQDKAREHIGELRLKNLEHLRNFWLNLLIMVAAGLIPVFGLNRFELINNFYLFYSGLFLWSLTLVMGVLYFNYILSRENNNLLALDKYYKDSFNKYKNKLIN
jgi:hypothetical protein